MKKLVIAIHFFLCGTAFSQSKLYVSGLAPTFTVIQNSYWYKVPTAYPNVIFKLTSTYIPSTVSSSYISLTDNNTWPQPYRTMCVQYVTAPLAAQTILSGSTIQFQFRINRSTASGTFQSYPFMTIRVINNNGTIASEIDTLAGTALPSSTSTNYALVYTFKNNVSIAYNQRICFEFGGRQDAVLNTTSIRWTSQYLYNNTDAPLGDNTSTANNNCYMIFSQTLKFAYQKNIF